MRVFLSLVVFFIFLSIIGCSKNENDPLSANEEGMTLKLTVNAADVYYIRLQDLSAVEVTDPLWDDSWDLSIENLTDIKLNGGSTAPGQVFAKMVDNMQWGDISTAPEAVYGTDDQYGNYIGENWYYYDVNTHSVNPNDNSYVIRATDGSYYKFRVKETVFTSRTDGELTLISSRVNDPASAETADVTGRVLTARFPLIGGVPTFFSLPQGKVVDVTDGSSSLAWDLQSDFVTIYANGGSSGPGAAAAAIYEDLDFDSVMVMPLGGIFVEDDSTMGKFAIGDSWYDYNPTTHTLSLKPVMYLLKTADGHFAKLQIIAADFAGQNGGEAIIKVEYVTGTTF